MADHTKLTVWHRSLRLSIDMHRSAHLIDTRAAPGLSAQLLRCVAAIPANIAEGAGQESPAQNARFLSIAIASTNEAQNHLAFAMGLGMLLAEGPTYDQELLELRRMLIALRRRVRGS